MPKSGRERAEHYKQKIETANFNPDVQAQKKSYLKVCFSQARLDNLVSHILDKYSVLGHLRNVYNSFAQKLFKLSLKYRANVFMNEALIALERWGNYGNDEIFLEIFGLFGLKIKFFILDISRLDVGMLK